MKIAPVSADLLVKLAIGLAVVGGAWYVLSKGVSGFKNAVSSITNLPGDLYHSAADKVGQVADAAIASAKEGGATWQAGYVPNDNYGNEGRYSVPYVGKYSNPMVNDMGYDFGQLSG